MIATWLLAAAIGADGLDWKTLPGGRFLFFAVLEGLYEDGVTAEQARRILMTDEPEGNTHPGKFAFLHFIACCPLCDATIDAVRAYQARPSMHQYGGSTIGPGLDPETAKALASASRAERVSAIGKLVGRWAQRRYDHLKLTEDELTKLAESLEYGSKWGMNFLGNAQSRGYPHKGCAACNAATGVCSMPRRAPAPTEAPNPQRIVPASERPAPPSALPVGKWKVEFSNGVKETCAIGAGGEASVEEPLRRSMGTVTVKGGAFAILFADDRLERWTRVGKHMVVEHWFPAAQAPVVPPVLGIAERAP